MGGVDNSHTMGLEGEPSSGASPLANEAVAIYSGENSDFPLVLPFEEE